MNCDVCGGESGGTYVGVAAIPGVPMSIAWCSECMKRDSTPSFVFDHDYIFVARGDLDALAPWARARVTWADGRYIPFDEYAQRISADQVRQELVDYDRVQSGGTA